MPGPLDAFLGRQLDRPITRPPGLALWLQDRPSAPVTLGLALQHVAIQSVYFVLPTVQAFSLSPDPALAARFLALSILALAVWQLLGVLVRGPVGSGYPIPATHTVALIGAFAISGAAGVGFGGAAAMTVVLGLLCILLTFVMHRLRVLMPNEVSGVVVMLIGVALVALAMQRLGLVPGHGPPAEPLAVGVTLGCLLLIALISLTRTRAARLSVLLGAAVGTAVALGLGQVRPDAAALLAAQPWFALPQPFVPDFTDVQVGPMAAFLVALVAIKASAAGNLVVMQRACDADWSRPDAPPLRRGLLANGLGVLFAGLVGAATPAPATAAVGLSIATGTLTRILVPVGAAVLVVAALCPKLVMLFVLVPEPVKAAMLFYVAGFIMAQGCQLVTARLLDMRRTLVVSLGLCSGVAVAVAPQVFARALPALASPLAVGALVAFLTHVLTLPLVARRATLDLPLDARASRSVTDWVAETAGGWALKPQTARAATQSLGELAELLQERGIPRLALAARQAEDRVEFTLAWTGDALPDPPTVADPEDLMGPDDLRQRFTMWLATRQAQAFRQREAEGRREAWLSFED